MSGPPPSPSPSLPAAGLLPHRPPMLMIEELLEWSGDAARARTRFGAEHFAVHEGRVHEAALVEAVAQTFAAKVGAERAAGEVTIDAAAEATVDAFADETSDEASDAPEEAVSASADSEPGLLAGVSDFVFHSDVSAGEELILEVAEKKRLGMMAIISGRVLRGGEVVAEGEIKVYG